jgi:hypothetical protein
MKTFNNILDSVVNKRCKQLTTEQEDLVASIVDLCDVDNIIVNDYDIEYYMSECSRIGLDYMKQRIIDKSNEISIDLYKDV